MKLKSFLFICIVCFLSFFVISGCKSYQASKSQKQIEKTKAERKKEVELQYQDAVKRHQDIQSKETRKRMKQTQKRADKINQPKKKGFFLIRWFGKKNCSE